MTTTISVTEETNKTFRKLSSMAKIPLIDLMDEIAKEIEKLLTDGIDENATRINFMADFDVKNCMVHLRASPLYTSLTQLPFEIQQQIKKSEEEREKA